RGRITIPNVSASKLYEVRAITVVTDEPIAAMLRKSEGPAHTEWKKESLKNYYKFAPGSLKYIVAAASELYRKLTFNPTEVDKATLLPVFWLPSPNGNDPNGETKFRVQVPNHDSILGYTKNSSTFHIFTKFI